MDEGVCEFIQKQEPKARRDLLGILLCFFKKLLFTEYGDNVTRRRSRSASLHAFAPLPRSAKVRLHGGRYSLVLRSKYLAVPLRMTRWGGVRKIKKLVWVDVRTD